MSERNDKEYIFFTSVPQLVLDDDNDDAIEIIDVFPLEFRWK